MVQKITVVIGGINGKMGRASALAIMADDELELVGAFGRAGASYCGTPVASLAGLAAPAGSTDPVIGSNFADVLTSLRPDVYIDFTRAEAAVEHSKFAIERGIRPVIGTSGIPEQAQKELSELAKERKVGGAIIPNFSVGAVLMMEFARQAGRLFSNVEIVEMHGPKKVDAPSGTAMYTLAKLASTGRAFNPPEVQEKELLSGSRGAAGAAGVRVHSLRLPGLISSQEVIFGSAGELLTIRHDSTSTDCFTRGILMTLKAVKSIDYLIVGLDKLLPLKDETVV